MFIWKNIFYVIVEASVEVFIFHFINERQFKFTSKKKLIILLFFIYYYIIMAEYKLIFIEYGKNSEYPDINK